jgi:Spy/CpxP family protein refolding chaperone
MRLLVFCGCWLLAVAAYAAEAETSPQVIQEPTLHDHYVAMKQMQERLAGRSLDEQAKLQPQIQRAQQKACQRLRKDHQERIPREEYRRQGGDEFLVFSWELEQWCATAH